MPAIDLGLIVTATNNASSALRGVSNDVKSIGDNAQATHNRLKAIQVVLAGIAFEKTLELSKAFLEVAASNQMADVRLTAFTGSVKASQQVMEHFNSTIAASGVANNDLANAYARLATTGISSGKITETIDHLVDGITALGSKDVSGSLDAAVTAFQRFSAKGVVSTRELNAIVNSTGITVAEMSKAMGVSITQFYDQLKDKTTSASTLLDAFNKAAETKFGGFASLLGNTVGGALNEFKFHLDDALGSMANNTGLDAGIVAFIHNLDDAVTSFIKTISAKDIDNFFQLFRDAAPIIANVVDILIQVGKAVVVIVQVTSTFLSLLPDDAVEFGIVGYVLMGKKGAVLLGLLGAAAGKLADLGAQVKQIASQYDSLPESKDASGTSSRYQTVLNTLNKNNPDSPISNMFRAMTYWAAAGAGELENKLTPAVTDATNSLSKLLGVGEGKKTDWVSKLLPTKDQIASIEKALQDLGNRKPITGLQTGVPGNTALDNQLAALRTEAENTLNKVGGQDQLLQFKNAGDELGATIQGIVNNTGQWLAQLATLQDKIDHSKLSHAEIAKYDGQIAALAKQINTDTANAIALETRLNALKQQGVVLAQQAERAANALTQNALEATVGNQTNGWKALLSGTSVGQAQNQVQQQHLQYLQQVLEYQQKINQLQQDALKNPSQAAEIGKTIESYQGLINITQQANDSLSAAAQLQIQYYQQLGQTIENDIADGISQVIQGTESWQDAARKLFADLISESIKYITQLLIMKALESIGGFANGGIFPGGIEPFANGGIAQKGGSQVTAFANGGLVTGPTLFGLAGEAGTEAIMPLTRIGGKLGVRAQGSGGDHYHISVQAIDTQSGLEFIGKHIGVIDNHLTHRKMLNKRSRGG